MAQKFHKITGDSLNEAYDELRRTLGKDAVVLRTQQVREGGILGFLGRKRFELTASAAAEDPRSRKLTPIERKYVTGAGVGSDEQFTRTVAHFQKLIHGRQPRHEQKKAGPHRKLPASPLGVSSAAPRVPSPALHAASEAPVLPFRQPDATPEPADALRREMREMRETLEVLVTETPGGGVVSEFASVFRELVGRGMPKKLAASLVGKTARSDEPYVLRDLDVFRDRLKAQMRRRISVTGGIELTPGQRRVVALVGTTGVGKTTNLAKLAAHFAVRRRARVALVTADTYRVAAPEQLKVYADIIGLPMKIANDPKETAAALRAFQDYDLVLIDTAGGSQFNVRHLRELKDTLSAARADEIILVVAAGGPLDDLLHAMHNFRCLRPTSLMFSKLDETRKLGAMFALLVETKLPVSYLSVGQEVPDDIRVARADTLANLIVEKDRKRG